VNGHDRRPISARGRWRRRATETETPEACCAGDRDRRRSCRKDGDDRHQLIASVHAFIAMYRPQAAREDTDLFPLLKTVVSPHEYDAMAEDFERKEHQLFGGDGFEMMVHRVASLEQQIGIADLAQFTPA
jgi:hypothetical protein